MPAIDILDLVEMETGLALRLIWKGALLKDDNFVAPGAELHAVFRLCAVYMPSVMAAIFCGIPTYLYLL
jgi:hypothetical protein